MRRSPIEVGRIKDLPSQPDFPRLYKNHDIEFSMKFKGLMEIIERAPQVCRSVRQSLSLAMGGGGRIEQETRPITSCLHVSRYRTLS